MRKHTLLCFGWTLLLFTSAFAKEYRSEHFVIHSDLDARYVHFVRANAEAYYRNMVGRYFRTGGGKPLPIYFSRTHSDTFKLLYKHKLKGGKHGNEIQARCSYYVPTIPAIYTHQFTREGDLIGLGTLFHEITHHFVRLNFKDPPIWFNEGLACFFGNETVIVKGKVTLGEPNPWRERKLKERIEKNVRPDIRRLLSMSRKQLYNWPIGYNFSRALFYWLHESGKLEKYLQNVRKNGYGLRVLEQTVHKSVNEINKELLTFIKKHCYAGAYLKDGQRTRDPAEKKEAFLKALQLRPYYAKAHLELARCYYRSKDYDAARAHLKRILLDTESIEYRAAAEQIGHSYYKEKNYAEALKYYKMALDYSDYYEYKYELYYWMANCHHYLKDYATAKKLHKMFLDNNWEPERLSKKVEYAKKYQKWSGKD